MAKDRSLQSKQLSSITQQTPAHTLGNARYFANGSEGRAASAHYCVDEKNVVYECVPLDTVAWSVGDGQSGKYGRVYNNYNTVSIEMVSHTDSAGRYYIPEETMRNAARLYQMLLKKLPNVKVDEVVEKSKIIVNGKECPVDRILKDGTNYIKIRDLAAALDLEVSNQGNIAVLNTKK